jgi:hypothetical protein
MATGAIAEHMYDVYTQMDMGLERAFYVFRGRGLYWSKPLEHILVVNKNGENRDINRFPLGFQLEIQSNANVDLRSQLLACSTSSYTPSRYGLAHVAICGV